ASSTALGWRKPAVVTSWTCGGTGQRAISSRSRRAVVDLPTGSEPAAPRMCGARRWCRARKVCRGLRRGCAAAARMVSRREAGRGGLADRDRAGHPDDVRGAVLVLVQEALPGPAQRLRGRDLDVQQAGDGPVDGVDLAEVHAVAEPPQFRHVLLGQRKRGLL